MSVEPSLKSLDPGSLGPIFALSSVSSFPVMWNNEESTDSELHGPAPMTTVFPWKHMGSNWESRGG